uniref:Attractin like 1 n=1 Tax=Ursus maritimus TaxID=29073 RepID=A0A452T5M2_URSMA
EGTAVELPEGRCWEKLLVAGLLAITFYRSLVLEKPSCRRLSTLQPGSKTSLLYFKVIVFMILFSRLTEPSGYLTDGPINYKYKTKCTWLIEGYPNAVLRLRFNHFATECSWDHMYVYDGDSIYAPLIAVLSGLIVPEIRGNETVPEVVTTSGYALLHFFSDAAYNLTGFNIFYSINSCPNNCSGHGKCTTSISVPSQVYCECDKYWKGEACDIPYCKANCGSPDHGYCDLTGEKLCVCNDSWQGPDCSLNVPSTESYWILPNVKPFSPSVGRASHKAVLHGKFMWVIGGYTFNYSSFQMVLKKTSLCMEAELKQMMAMSQMNYGFLTYIVSHGVQRLLLFLDMVSSMLWRDIQHTLWSWIVEMLS